MIRHVALRFYNKDRSDEMVKPIEVARRLKISTSALRHYEAWGLVPKVKRASNGYREYTDEHVAYFECIRAMNTGFGMNVVRDVMPLIQEGNFTKALWIVNNVQVDMHNHKKKAEQALAILERDEGGENVPAFKKKMYTIGEAAEQIGVPDSTLRHWEKKGLIKPKRDGENGYRIYDASDLRKLLVIRSLQTAVKSLETVREVLEEMDQNNIAEAIKKTKESLVYLDYIIKEQLRGMGFLYQLCEIIDRKGGKEQ